MLNKTGETSLVFINLLFRERNWFIQHKIY